MFFLRFFFIIFFFLYKTKKSVEIKICCIQKHPLSHTHTLFKQYKFFPFYIIIKFISYTTGILYRCSLSKLICSCRNEILNRTCDDTLNAFYVHTATLADAIRSLGARYCNLILPVYRLLYYRNNNYNKANFMVKVLLWIWLNSYGIFFTYVVLL